MSYFLAVLNKSKVWTISGHFDNFWILVILLDFWGYFEILGIFRCFGKFGTGYKFETILKILRALWENWYLGISRHFRKITNFGLFQSFGYFEHHGIFPVFWMSFCTLGQLCTTGKFSSIWKILIFFAQFLGTFGVFSHRINFLDFVAKGSSFHGLVKITWMKFMELKT